LHADFEAQAARTPDAVALSFGDTSITYSELADRCSRVAAALSRRGIGQGSCVALHVDRSIDYVACVLGILKTNAAVLPLPPAYPRTRKVEVLTFSSLAAVIDDARTPLEPVEGTPVLHVADLDGEAATGPVEIAPGDPQQTAFVLCSSGSTGKPKMIARSHRSFYHRLRWTWRTHPYEPGERCVQKSTMTTTHHIYELFEPLLRGVPTWILGDPEARNLEQFWGTINGKAITRLLVVPSALQVSLEDPAFAVPSLKVLVLMGEYVHHRLAGRAIQALPERAALYSIYGSTEASSTLLCDLRELYRPNEELPLGKPLTPEVQAHVLGADLRPVTPGETGVLHFGGTALFSGYFGDPELTASVFVRAPVAETPLYDTHDQVRLMPDGNLHYVGRTDHTVKVRGYRVDLQEVERALLLHPDINHGAVVLSNGDAASAALLGFYSPDTVDRAGVQRFLQERLPAYMVPSALVGLKALPRTASGKTDRRTLLEDYTRRAATGAADAGGTDTEGKVRELWKTLLRHQNVGNDSNFFEVGGTSLTAFAAVQRLRDAFELDRNQLSDQALYLNPTVREMAALIDRLRAGHAPEMPAGNNVLVRLRKGGDQTLPPLFLIASAGGTLGAYDKLTRALRTERDVIGVRDPYVLGERDPTQSFQQWVSLYVDAIRQRQPQGPYCIVAYSSAGAFGYEIARRLRRDGQTVELLALVDPFGLDRPTPDSFGYRVMQARFRGPHFKLAVRLAGWLRSLLHNYTSRDESDEAGADLVFTSEQVTERIRQARRSRGDVVGFSALLELNTGLPFGFTDAQLAPLDPEQYFPAFLQRVREVAPDLDLQFVERIFEQYYGLQVPAQQCYRLQPYDGDVLLIELDGPSKGLVSAQLRPHARRLRSRRLKVGPQSERNAAVSRVLSTGLRDHYLCMRNDEFVASLAAELEGALR
jgi:amino acid adenylation domain-containing protein